MNSNNGYVYIRQHIYYNNDKICKLGKSKNIPNRDNCYATSEYRRGYFVLVIEILNNQIYDDTYVEKLLQRYYKKYHSKIDGGSEFYDIKNLILPEGNKEEFIKYMEHSNKSFDNVFFVKTAAICL